MQDAQNAATQAVPVVKKHIKSFWLYVTLGTLAFLVGGFVIWQVYNYNLDEEISASALIKTRMTERPMPAGRVLPGQK